MNSQKKSNLGDDIVNMYKNYKNAQTKWKQSIVGDVMFQLPDYYQTIKLIGKGAYGAVASAIDNRLPQKLRKSNKVAIKKMMNAFQNKTYAKRILRQLKLLRLLKHVNIIDVRTIILPKSRQLFEDIYVVFQLMESDVYTVVNKFSQKLTDLQYQYFIYQILRGLMYIHSANVIHRDLKTSNLLVNNDCDIKICDFGLSRASIIEKDEGMTNNVATRWYKAPELLLGQTSYTPAIDIWSVGCIMAQIILNTPFLPARSTEQQLQFICQLVDLSDLNDLKEKNQKNFKIIQSILEKKKKKKKTNLIQEKFSTCSPQARQLLKRMLALEPSKRITAKQAINLPYFKDIRYQKYQTTRQPIDPLEFEFDKHNLTTQQLKDMIYEQILLYHFKNFEKAYKEKLAQKLSVIDHIINNSNSKNISSYTNINDQ